MDPGGSAADRQLDVKPLSSEMGSRAEQAHREMLSASKGDAGIVAA